MNPKSLILGAFFIITLFFLLPALSILVNQKLHLPIITLPLAKPIGILILTCALLIYFHCFYLFFFVGQGTPAPTDPPKKFVSQGLYQYTRNPMYIANFLTALSCFFFFGHLLLLIYPFLLFIFFNLFLTLYEEPQLKNRFGKPYLDYFQKTPRWIKI